MSIQALSPAELERLLLEYHFLTNDQFELVKEHSEREKTDLISAILWFNFVSDEQLGKLIADFIKFPFVVLMQQTMADETLQLIPEVVARRHKILAFRQTKEGLDVAMNDPIDIELSNFLERKIGLPVHRFYATERDLNEALSFYHVGTPRAIEEMLSENIQEASHTLGDTVDPPVIRIADMLFQYAHQNRASDIHLEPREDESLVRFRIDGVLHDIVRLPLSIHNQLVSHLKVRSGLRTDEHQTPQDGKLRAVTRNEDIDVRISVIPITHGEKIVLRMLSDRSRQFALNNLGLEKDDLAKIETAYHKPYGMILVTGPTGCGKTTTLYALLKLLNRRNVNIVTIEDPVEYDIEGVNQIQVNTATNLTFATGIRSILRQDPNVILVGEIRDNETARIAVNLAMTGHLVLSTLHTNNAATAIPRLLDMGIEPFLIASTVSVIVAQRLVRTIHPACRFSGEITTADLQEQLGSEAIGNFLQKHISAGTLRTYQGKGCEGCHETGYQGRTGIFEVMEINETLRQAITHAANAGEIQKFAQQSGMRTMHEDGLAKALQGITTIAEVVRASKE